MTNVEGFVIVGLLNSKLIISMKNLIKSACEEFRLLYPLRLKTSLDEKYDTRYLHHISEKIEYVFLHWSLQDTLSNPESSLSKLYLEGSREMLSHRLSYQPRKLGDITLRVINYLESKPFGSHFDISYCTFVLGSMNSKGVRLSKKLHYGLQAEMVGDNSATPHKFNATEVGSFSVVLFQNLHYSVKLKTGQTVGDYLNEVYYNTK